MRDDKPGPPAEAGGGPEMRKTNELISRPLVRGHFTLLGRKVLNAMILHAQAAGRPGVNAPLPGPAYEKLFWVPLADVARDARYDSKDTEMLKDVARQLMEIQVEGETDTEWTADHVVEQVKIVNPAGLRKRGGKLWLGYRFPDEVMHLVLDPKRYTRLPLYYLTMLRSKAAAALYEIAKQSAWKSSGLTAKAPWEDWQALLEGRPKAELGEWKEYKYFKDRMIKKALTEINALTDVEVDLIEYKNGRKVGDLQFRVRKKEQGLLPFAPPPAVDAALAESIQAFGISRREAEDLTAAHDEGLLRRTCAYVRKRMESPTLPAVSSAAAFFRSALRGGYADSEPKPKALPAPKAKTAKDPDGEEKAKASAAAAAAFGTLGDAEREEALAAFFAGNPAVLKMSKGKITKMVLSMAASWWAAGRPAPGARPQA